MKGVKHEPTAKDRKTVEALIGFGVPQDDIAAMIGIDPTTLRRHYALEIATGTAKANAKVAENLFKIATGTGREAVTAAIFWLKTRAGWSEYNLMPPRAPVPGKKEAADEEAGNLPQDKEWADLLPGRQPN